MAAEILTVHGGSVPNQPNHSAIEMLERLLEEARSGRMLGFAYATVGRDKSKATGWTGEAGSRDPMLTSISILHSRYIRAIENDD